MPNPYVPTNLSVCTIPSSTSSSHHIYIYRETTCYGLNMKCPPQASFIWCWSLDARRLQDGETARKSQQPPTGWRSKQGSKHSSTTAGAPAACSPERPPWRQRNTLASLFLPMSNLLMVLLIGWTLVEFTEGAPAREGWEGHPTS